MNREQKQAAVAEIAEQIKESEAIFAVDYRGISVTQAADVRGRLREADATFRVVKNSLTERAADDAGVEDLKVLLTGPTALTFVRGDAAAAAKAIATFNRETELLEFKGGVMDGAPLEVDQIKAIAKLPPREVLYGQLVGVVAAPLTGLVRGLGGLIGGLAIALGDLQAKKESGEVPAGEAPAAVAESADAPAPAGGEEPPAEGATLDEGDQDAEPPAQQAEHTEEPAEGADDASAAPQDETTDTSDENEADASA
jgi:large subunit ribosomal protein L10